MKVILKKEVNMLDEVYIGYQLTGNLAVDAKNIVTEQRVDYNAQFKGVALTRGSITPDAQSGVVNQVIAQNNGINMMPLVKGIAGLMGGKDEMNKTKVPKNYLTLNYLKHHLGIQFLVKDLNLH